ncbi:S-adenosylmethionine decarboxylase [Niveibacterium sp. 24ML]|uniref:S-adenosylmethionine decarboxylase family protein n=1 Tax=Niveibacterium sp. 24ML TaxID=2985512 RepID=UPI002270DAF1|nr:S-adenosylmethionine decarboxylase [Niveibacterium sp. 24ML]MCX9155741.1 S-adenosylmethionine decarboxylase [Niveibacterium sp. 24ML]
MQGLHLTADLLDCACSDALLSDLDALAAACRADTVAAGLTLVSELFHRFPAPPDGLAGITGVLLLAESHLAVHTWPEVRGVTLDAYVCNYSADNSARAEALVAALLARFEPRRVTRNRLMRGV